jgi:hypothetical protein
MKEIEQDLLSQSIETDSQTNESSRQSINESVNQSTNNLRLTKMATLFKKSDETQAEITEASDKKPEKAKTGYRVFEGTQPDSEIPETLPGYKPNSGGLKANRKSWKTGEVAPKPGEVASEVQVHSEPTEVAQASSKSVESVSELVEVVSENVVIDESVSLNLFQDNLMKSLEWSKTYDRNSKNIPGELIRVAESLELGKVYLPTWGDPKDESKKPVAEVARTWNKTQYEPGELAQFPRMTILSVYLGDQFAVLDPDGSTAVSLLMTYLENFEPETLEVVKNTLWVSSDRQSHFGIWFRIPEKFQGKLKKKVKPTDDSEQLEFRTGDHYQCLAGKHPGSGMYWSNQKEILEMPLELCELWLNIQEGDRKTSEEPKKVTEIDTTDFQLAAVQTLLGFLTSIESDEIDTGDYDLWLRVGMIIHSVDESEAGLNIWDDWSKDLKEDENGNWVITNPKYEPGACEKKWASFDSEGDTISIGSLYFWLQKESEKITDPVKRSEFQGSIERLKATCSTKWTIETIPGAIAEFKELGLQGQSLELAIQRLAKDAYGSASEHNLNLVWDLYNQEGISEEDKQEAQNIIQSFRDLKNFELDARFIIGDTDLGKDLCQFYDNVGSIPGYEVVNFLPPLASNIKKYVSYAADQDQKAKPILYVANIGTPGTGKNRVGKHYIKPLEEVTMLDSQKYKDAKKKWEKDVAAWKTVRKSGDANGKSAEEVRKIHWENYLTKLGEVALDSDRDVTEETMLEVLLPEPPEPEIRALIEFTPEKATDISANQKTWGTLACPDELSQIINGSKYSGGSKSGVDFSMMRNAWGGGLAQKLVMKEVREVDYFQMSMLTTGHPQKTFQWFDKDDCEGDLSRIIFCPVTEKIKFVSNPDPNNPDGCFPMQKLIKCYDGIRNLFPLASSENPHVILPTIPAKALWIKFKNDTEALAEKLDHQGMQSRLYRTPEQVARIALVLHCFYIQQGLFNEGDRLDVYTMERAIAIGWASIKWAYIAYPGAISALAENNPDSDLIEFYSKLVEKLQRKRGYELGQEVTLRSIQDEFRGAALIERFGTKGKKRLIKEQPLKCLEALKGLGLIEYRTCILREN